MHISVYSTKSYDRDSLVAALNIREEKEKHTFHFHDCLLNEETAPRAAGSTAVCIFVNDKAGEAVLNILASVGVKLILLRCAGFNNVDLKVAESLGFTILRVPAYSPDCVAEHAVGLMLTLNRKIHRAFNRVRDHNFSLEGLLGFQMRGKTVGVLGTGKIGEAACRILLGFGCTVIAHDVYQSESVKKMGIQYVSLEELLQKSDIITIHCPLLPDTHHLIDAKRIALCKRGVMIINTSRGPLINTPDVIAALKTGQIGYLGLDVYEGEQSLFFRDLSEEAVPDEFSALLGMPNVIVTAHQAFFTKEALESIANQTIGNLCDFDAGKPIQANLVTAKMA